jgi:hypothetical protein
MLQRRWQVVVRLLTLSVVWAAGVLLAALLVRVDRGQTVATADGLTLTARTLVQEHGAEALVLVLVPVAAGLLAAGGLWSRRYRDAPWGAALAWAATAAVAVEAVLAITSFGGLLIPVAVLLGCSAWLAPRRLTAPARAPA